MSSLSPEARAVEFAKIIEELAREHNKKMDIWVDDYTQTHGKNPLED